MAKRDFEFLEQKGIKLSDFTDDGHLDGHLDLSTSLPDDAIPIAWVVEPIVQLLGDQLLSFFVGIPSDAKLYSADHTVALHTLDLVASGVPPRLAGRGIGVARTVRLTIEARLDFGDISQGEFDFRLHYLRL